MAEDIVYVGTYTRGGRSDGIHVFSCDPSSGRLTWRSKVAETDPSWLCLHPSRRFLFATSEGLTAENAAVASFAIDPSTGSLVPLSRQLTRGGEPCHLCTDPTGKFLIVANHENGTVAVFPIHADGTLGEMTDFVQHAGTAPHAHHVTFDPARRRVLLTDKGIDKVMIYALSDAGKLVANDPPFGRVHAGAQPRHLAFSPDGKVGYVNGEADMTLAAFTYAGSTGAMHEFQVESTLPQGTAPNPDYSTAEVAIAPSGTHAYVSNRGHHSIAVFGIEATTGRLRPVGHVSSGGQTPRNFAIHPNGRWLYAANQESDSIVQFEIDGVSGLLNATGEVTEVGAPVCIVFS